MRHLEPVAFLRVLPCDGDFSGATGGPEQPFTEGLHFWIVHSSDTRPSLTA